MSLRLPDPALSWPGGSLRPWRIDDVSTLLVAWADPEIGRWNPVPVDATIDRADRWLAGYDERISRGLALDLVIIDAATGAAIGEVGISNLDSRQRAALIGYWLLPEARGRGFAAQAVDALSAWLLDDGGLRLLVARCAVANEASQHVAARAGYRYRRVDDDGYQLWARSAAGEHGESSP